MNQRRTVISLLFVTAVAVTAGLVACKSSGPPPPPAAHLDGLRDTIRDRIEDPQLELAMSAEVDRMQAAIEETGAVLSRHHETVLDLYRDYDSTRPEVERELDVYETEREQVARRFADAHFALKALSPDDAWPKIAKAEDDAIEAMTSVTMADRPEMEE